MIAFPIAAAQLFAPPARPAPPVDCKFDSASLTFAGSPRAQARCLLRHVRPGGSADDEVELPPTLAALIGERPEIDFPKLASALRHAHIPLPAATPVSETSDHRRALYFVIHDTSSPYVGDAPFARGFDQLSRYNDINQFLGKDAVAHLFNDRAGPAFPVGHDFEVGLASLPSSSRRRRSRRGGASSMSRTFSLAAHDPGGPPWTTIGLIHVYRQYKTLALLYVPGH